MRFVGTIRGVGDKPIPIRFEIRPPRRSHKAPFECEVWTTYPKELTTRLFGVSEENAHDAAVSFLASLLAGHELFNDEGERVEFVDAHAALDQEQLEPPAPGDPGLVVFLARGAGSRLRVVMEDVERANDAWTVQRLFTHNAYERDELMALSLSERQLADIGLAVVARLVALAGTQGRSRP